MKHIFILFCFLLSCSILPAQDVFIPVPKMPEKKARGGLQLDSMIVGNIKCTGLYDSRGNRLEEIRFGKDKNNEWQVSVKYEYAYDESDNQTLSVYSTSKNSQWQLTSKVESVYDSRGKMTLQQTTRWENGSWLPWRKKEIVYEDNKEWTVESQWEEWRDNVNEWVAVKRSETRHLSDNTGSTVLTIDSLQSDYNYKTKESAWTIRTTTDVYDSRHNLLSHTVSGDDKKEYEYTADNKQQSVTDYDWNSYDGIWHLYSKTETGYDLSANTSVRYFYYWKTVNDSREFGLRAKQERQYDADGETAAMRSWSLDEVTGTWFLDGETTMEITNLENKKHKHWTEYAYSQEWGTRKYLRDSIFDPYGNLLEYKEVMYVEDQLNHQKSELYYYSVLSTAIHPVASQSAVKIFPNPVSDEFTIEGLTRLSEATITDISGRILLHQTAGNGSTVNIRSFAPGIYLLQLNKGKVIRLIKR